jgi:hypothetical protein
MTHITVNAASRKSSTREPEEGVVADEDVDMDAAGPGASASIRVKKRKVPVKVRCGLILVPWRVLMVRYCDRSPKTRFTSPTTQGARDARRQGSMTPSRACPTWARSALGANGRSKPAPWCLVSTLIPFIPCDTELLDVARREVVELDNSSDNEEAPV